MLKLNIGKAPVIQQGQSRGPARHTVPVAISHMDSLPTRIINTESKKFHALDSATNRGEVIDKGFACLSYIWEETGDDRGRAVIDGITANLNVKRDLMGAIRYAEFIGVKYLWIDALCIDQNNSDEIQEEIERMHMYFTVCDLVIVWTAKKRFGGSIEPDFEKAQAQFVNSDWLKRSWTVQEGVLASRLVVATDWGLIFPDALHEQEVRTEMKPTQGFATLLSSRHRRSMIASEVLGLAKGRKASRTIDRIQSLSAMLPYTRHLQLSKQSDIKYAEETYLNALFASKDISPLCCFIDHIGKGTWSWRPDIDAYAFPSNVRLCAHNASHVPRITAAGLRVHAKIVSCIVGNTDYIDWKTQFPESRDAFGSHRSGLQITANGMLRIQDDAVAKQIILFITKWYTTGDRISSKIDEYMRRLRVVALSSNLMSVTFLDNSKQIDDITVDSSLCVLLPGIVSNGSEVGILAKRDAAEGTYRRLGLSFMSQRVALQTMSCNLTKVLLI